MDSAPPEVRELRELVRYRAKLVALRSGLKAQVHAVMAKQGVLPQLDDMFGPGGPRLLDTIPFGLRPRKDGPLGQSPLDIQSSFRNAVLDVT